MAVPNVNKVNICNGDLSNDFPGPVVDRMAAANLSPSTVCSTDMVHGLLHSVGTPSVNRAGDACLMDNKYVCFYYRDYKVFLSDLISEL